MGAIQLAEEALPGIDEPPEGGVKARIFRELGTEVIGRQ
jgi:hypothetical protein